MREAPAIKPKILIDKTIPPSLADQFKNQGMNVKHVVDIFGTLNVSDKEIKKYAEENDMIVLTTDKNKPYKNKIIYSGVIKNLINPTKQVSSSVNSVRKITRKPLKAIKII